MRQRIPERDDDETSAPATCHRLAFRRQATEALRRRSTTASTTRLNMSGFSTATWLVTSSPLAVKSLPGRA